MPLCFGDKCIQCNQDDARHLSHFCSESCLRAFGARVDGPVDCSGCMAQCDDLAEARECGWRDIEEDFEGITWNYLGICPECQREEKEQASA